MVKLETTKRGLAAQMSIRSKILSHTLGKFRAAGWIEVKGKQISVLKRQGLEALLRKNVGA